MILENIQSTGFSMLSMSIQSYWRLHFQRTLDQLKFGLEKGIHHPNESIVTFTAVTLIFLIIETFPSHGEVIFETSECSVLLNSIDE
jgi:hypothetical protein